MQLHPGALTLDQLRAIHAGVLPLSLDRRPRPASSPARR
jgi:hypothetical protein